jgi:hypothetical protein
MVVVDLTCNGTKIYGVPRIVFLSLYPDVVIPKFVLFSNCPKKMWYQNKTVCHHIPPNVMLDHRLPQKHAIS